MEEMVDIFNDRNELIGSATKKEAHSKGLWHRVFTCLLIDPNDKTVVLQKKTPGRYEFERPDYLDISVGGHLQLGENIKDGVREIKEEIGLDVDYKNLHYIGIRQNAVTLSSNYINNEFQYIHLLEYDADFVRFQLSNIDEEVSGLVKVPISDGIKLLKGEIDTLSVEGLFLIEENKKIKKIEITINDFVPNYLKTDEIFLRLFIAAEKLLNRDSNERLFW